MDRRRIFLLPGGRKPVQLRRPMGLADVQDQPPAGWCGLCGAEVYRGQVTRCDRCRTLGLGGR